MLPTDPDHPFRRPLPEVPLWPELIPWVQPEGQQVVDIELLSDKDIAHLFLTSPSFRMCCHVRLVNIGNKYLIKTGPFVSEAEAEAQKLARYLGIDVPIVYRVVRDVDLPGFAPSYDQTKFCMIVMQFIPGKRLHHVWGDLVYDEIDQVCAKVASIILKLGNTPVNMPPGPLGATKAQKLSGPFFFKDGCGPFSNAKELNEHFNERVAQCVDRRALPRNTPPFRFRRLVLTHLEITPSSFIVEEGTGRLVLTDWDQAGVYPRGWDTACMFSQGIGEWSEDLKTNVAQNLPSSEILTRNQLFTLERAEGSLDGGLERRGFLSWPQWLTWDNTEDWNNVL